MDRPSLIAAAMPGPFALTSSKRVVNLMVITRLDDSQALAPLFSHSSFHNSPSNGRSKFEAEERGRCSRPRSALGASIWPVLQTTHTHTHTYTRRRLLTRGANRLRILDPTFPLSTGQKQQAKMKVKLRESLTFIFACC